MSNKSGEFPRNETSRHYPVGRYVTHQTDGVHVEAHCTFGLKLKECCKNVKVETQKQPYIL